MYTQKIIHESDFVEVMYGLSSQLFLFHTIEATLYFVSNIISSNERMDYFHTLLLEVKMDNTLQENYLQIVCGL